MGCFATGDLPTVLGIAPPDDFPVRVRGMPDLRAKPSAALTASYLCAENGRTAEVAHLAALLDHNLFFNHTLLAPQQNLSPMFTVTVQPICKCRWTCNSKGG